MQTLLRKALNVSGLARGAAVIGRSAIAGAGDTLHWQSVIGIAQVNNVAGSGSGVVAGGGSPWSTLGGHVDVDLENGEFNSSLRRRRALTTSQRPNRCAVPRSTEPAALEITEVAAIDA